MHAPPEAGATTGRADPYEIFRAYGATEAGFVMVFIVPVGGLLISRVARCAGIGYMYRQTDAVALLALMGYD